MQDSGDNSDGGELPGEASAETPAALTPEGKGPVAPNENQTSPVTLNLFQGPFLRLTRGWSKGAFWPLSAKQAEAGLAAQWALKQVQGDDVGERGAGPGSGAAGAGPASGDASQATLGTNAFSAYARKLELRSQAVPRTLERHIETIAVIWACLLLFVSLPVVSSSPAPARGTLEALALALPYVFAAIAPLAGLRLAIRSFPDGLLIAAPAFHLFSFGRWRRLSVVEARAHPLFGPAGFMASLLIGLLLNIAVQSFEFLTAVPALGQSAPLWGRTLFGLMAADLILMNFFYMVCFVLALRSVPHFPKAMLFTWGLDLFTQMLMAARLGAVEGLPPNVAQPLQDLLFGNIQKVLISAAIWLPYLILSDRVNVTYRQRVRAPAAA